MSVNHGNIIFYAVTIIAGSGAWFFAGIKSTMLKAVNASGPVSRLHENHSYRIQAPEFTLFLQC